MAIMTWPMKAFLDLLRPLNANPVLWRIGRFQVVSFGLFAGLNALFSLGFILLYLESRGLHPRGNPVSWLLPAFLLEFGFARGFHLLALGRKFFRKPLKYLGETGFYNQGGIVGSIIWMAWLSASQGFDFLVLLDAGAWGAAIGLFFGRLGCYNYGCCWGRESASPLSVCYHHPQTKVLRLHPELAGRPLAPTQLYTAFFNLSLFGILTSLIPMGLPSGSLAGIFLVFHGSFRIYIERWRSDVHFHEGRNYFTALMAGAFIAAGCVLLTIRLVGGEWDHQSLAMGEGARKLFQSAPMLTSLGGMAFLTLLTRGVHGPKLGRYF